MATIFSLYLGRTFLLRHDRCQDLCIAGIVALGVAGLEDRVEWCG